MEQLSWMISFIPDSVLNLIYWVIILAGITGVAASWLARWIPFYGNYARLLKPLGVLLIILGVYLKGGLDTEMAWRQRVADLETKVKESEEKSKQVNEKIIVKYKDRVKVIKDTQIVVQEKIKEVEKLVDAKCEVAPEAVTILNDAAKKPERVQK